MPKEEIIDKVSIKDAEVKDVKAFIKKTKVQSETLKKIMNTLNVDNTEVIK